MHHSTSSVNGLRLRHRCSTVITVSVGALPGTPPDQAIDAAAAMSETKVGSDSVALPESCVECNSTTCCRSLPLLSASPRLRCGSTCHSSTRAIRTGWNNCWLPVCVKRRQGEIAGRVKIADLNLRVAARPTDRPCSRSRSASRRTSASLAGEVARPASMPFERPEEGGHVLDLSSIAGSRTGAG